LKAERRIDAMSTSGITSSLLSQISSSPAAADQFVTDLVERAVMAPNIPKVDADHHGKSSLSATGAPSSATATICSTGDRFFLMQNLPSDFA
jgi:hypothetical protein